MDKKERYFKSHDKVYIKKNPNGDTRTASKNVSFKDFAKANDMHRSDVRETLFRLAGYLEYTANEHDWSKKEYEKEFYDNFKDTLINGTDFVSNTWYQKHIVEERHHLTSHCSEDVDLFDVIEMIVDCVCAGKARSGHIRSLEINDSIMKKALENTVKLVDELVQVKEDKKDE